MKGYGLLIDKDKQTEQKLRGGYYTPKPIAKYLWDWVKEKNPQNLLEPSAGDGALLEFIDNKNININAIELFESEVSKLKEKDIIGVLNTFTGDFFQWFKNHNDYKYDSILSNPPYIRYQYLTEKQREEQATILRKNGMKPNKLINAWVAFVIASISLLKEGGRIGLVIPADFLQVTYAKQLRQFIVDKFSKINIVTFENNVFPGTQQDFILLLGEKGKEKAIVKYSTSKDIYDLPNFNYVDTIEISNDYANKWSDLKLPENIRAYWYKLIHQTISFNDIAKTEVGVTTGSNEIFSLTQQMVDNMDASEYVIPLLGRSVNVQKLIFDKQTLNNNAKMGQKVWLLDLIGHNKEELPEKLQKYLNKQESLGKTNAYKLRIRDNWYQIPGIWIPNAFMLRRIGTLPKLILNGNSAVSTDTFHRVTFKDNIDPIKVFFAFYSSISLSSFELAGRSYGGGALEILPGDIIDIRVPKINFEKDKCNLKNEFKTLNMLFENNKSVTEIAQFTDKVLIDRLNYQFDSEKVLEILTTLQTLRTGKHN